MNRNRVKFCFVLLYYVLINSFTLAQNENPYLKRYSKLNFDSNELNERHSRVRRSLDNHIRLKFQAHGKEFDLKLEPSTENFFESDFIEIGDEKIPISDFQIYEGKLVDEPEGSYVSGSIIDGAFLGKIVSQKDGVYYIEPANKYEDIKDAKTIIYHEDDVNTNEQVSKSRQERSGGESVNPDSLEGGVGCGATNKNTREKLAEEQSKINIEFRKKRGAELEKESSEFKYTEKANSRNKRQSSTFPGGKNYCYLYLKVDPFMYETIYNKEGNKDATLTRDHLLYYLTSQVTSLNDLFGSISSASSSYFQSSNPDNRLQFRIAKTKIYKNSDCTSSSLTNNEKKLCENYLDAITFLNYVSLDNFDEYCLSFTFTSRDFSDGTLGLAWLASTSGSGGICEKSVSVNGEAKSLNSGIVTIVNYNARVPDIVNQLTFAHEVGHSLGSEHDPSTSECSPGSPNGNYIMYSRSTSGTQTNNKKFSSCSISQMNSVFANLLGSNKNCLKLKNESICGNGIIDSGEVCDIGIPSGGSCCIACKSLRGECDPSQGPCCNPDTCLFYRDNRTCLAKDDCREDIRCNGVNATCPIEESKYFKKDLTLCNGNTQVCKGGSCNGSLCELYGLTQCYFEGNLNDSTVDKSALCRLACTGGLTNNQCKFTNAISEFSGQSYSLRPGSACSNNQGYCDYFSRCRSANAKGALSRLAQTLLAPTILTVEDLKTFAVKYWWAILLFCIVFLFINACFLFCIWRHMGSDNPEKNLPLRFRDTLKNPFRALESRPSGMKADQRVKRIRQDNVKPAPREVLPSVFYEDNNKNYDSSEINLKTIGSTKNLKKIRRTPRPGDDDY